MASEFTIKTAERTERRRFNKVFNNDLRRYVAEIAINADDSYKRLIHDGKLDAEKVVPIQIIINKTKKEVVVIDNAEGMNISDMTNAFSEYGADTGGGSEGKKVRSLFGQGATDVFLNVAQHGKQAEVLSFKDGDFYTLRFRWDENGEKKGTPQKPKMSNSQIRTMRSHYNIPENGTVVRFQLHDDIKIPREVVDEIRTFYMLRFIHINPKRNVTIKVISTAKSGKEEKLEYTFPEVKDEDTLADTDFNFDFRGNKVTGHIILLKINEADPENYGELKILTYDDDKNVYDNTLFNFDKAPGAETIHGYIELEGTYKIIRELLNKEHPEEILTDTRDGFNKGHDFYKSLYGAIDPIIGQVLKTVSDERKNKSVSLSNQKDWTEAFKEINKYFKQELEEELGGVAQGQQAPSEGMRFPFPNIKISLGKRYSLKLLINLDKVPVGTSIDSSITGDSTELVPENFKLNEADVVEGALAAKSFSILGNAVTEKPELLIAKSSNGFMAKLYVEVIDKDIHYPNYGLEFWPNSLFAKINNPTKAHLYFDVTKFPVGTEIKLEATDPSINLSNRIVTSSNTHLISEQIGVIECVFSCPVKDLAGSIFAKAGSRTTELKVVFKDHTPPPPGTGGFLTGVEILSSPQFWQTYYDPQSGKIKVNNKNPVNHLHLGEVTEINPEKLTKEQKKYLSELCSGESARQLIKLKIDKGKLPGDDYEAVLDDIQREKNKLLNIFLHNIDKLA